MTKETFACECGNTDAQEQGNANEYEKGNRYVLVDVALSSSFAGSSICSYEYAHMHVHEIHADNCGNLDAYGQGNRCQLMGNRCMKQANKCVWMYH